MRITALPVWLKYESSMTYPQGETSMAVVCVGSARRILILCVFYCWLVVMPGQTDNFEYWRHAPRQQGSADESTLNAVSFP